MNRASTKPGVLSALGRMALLSPALAVTVLAFATFPIAAALAETTRAPLDTRKGVDAKFTAGPETVRDGRQIRVRFAVSAATDVEVAILGANGKVVRHLVAGLLGPNAPEPLQKDSLKQELAWDGTDDLGEPANGGPFKVRVRIGSQPRLDRYLGWDGNTFADGIACLCVGAGGELYGLLADGNWSSHGRCQVRVLDRNGKYLRTILPYPANTPKERAASIGQLEIDGERIPVVFDGTSHTMAPLTRWITKQNMAFSSQGWLVLASGREWYSPRHLLALSPKGGVPEGMEFVGPKIAGENKKDMGVYFEHLATSPDGKAIYYTPFDGRPRHVVFRTAWGEKQLGQPFVGVEGEAGADDKHLNDPQGIATDRHGRLYVCDRGNKRVAVFSADGKFVGAFAAVEPEQVAVHPQTGEIYVVTRQKLDIERYADISSMSQSEYQAWKKAEAVRKANLPPPVPAALTKFAAWSAPGEQAKANVRQRARLELDVDLMALDGEATPPKLWVTVKNSLLPVIDHGEKFEAGEPVTTRKGVRYPTFLAADPDPGRLLYRDQLASWKPDSKAIIAVDLKTGERSPLLRSTDVAVDRRTGVLYGQGGYGSNAVFRFDADGNPLPFKGTDSNKIDTGPWTSYGVDLGIRRLCTDLRGNLYLIRSHGYSAEGGVGGKVDVFSPDGRKIKAGIIDGIGHADCGIGVDARGNIYIGSNIKPADAPLPLGVAGKVPVDTWTGWSKEPRSAPWCWMYRNPYLSDWGAVVKFGPEGGQYYGNCPQAGQVDQSGHEGASTRPDAVSPLVRASNAPAGAAVFRSSYLRQEVRVVGARWLCTGVGTIPATDVREMSAPFHCCCITSRLAVDEYGRVFAPDCFRFSVQMLDTNGNLIERIGRYGNADSQGPESLAPKPDIAFAAPRFVATGDGNVYVSDPINQRIVSIRFDYAAEETRELK